MLESSKGIKLSKDDTIKLARIQKKVDCFEANIKKNIKEWSNDDVEKFAMKYLVSQNRSSVYQNIKLINILLRVAGNDIQICSRKSAQGLLKIQENKYMTEQKMQDIVNCLVNPCDKWLVASLFYIPEMLSNTGVKNLRELTTDDVAKDFSYIIVDDKKIYLNKYLQRILRMTVKADVYYKHVSDEAALTSTDFYEFNMNSPYVLKIRPTKRNGGMTAWSVNSLNMRLKSINEQFAEAGGDVVLNVTGLMYSGVLFELFKLNVREGQQIDIDFVKEYLAVNNIKANPNELYSKYYHVYFDKANRF